MSPFYRVVKAVITPFVYFYFRLKKYGIHNIPKEDACIICCNHTSISDVLFLAALCPRQIHFMAKDELFKNKILGFFLYKLGAFPVNRRTGDKNAINRAEEILREGKILGIFPEGTRHTDGAPHKAKPGVSLIAMSTKAPILPCAVYRENARVHLFQKASFRFSNPISYEEYAGELTGKTAIRQITKLITEKITQLWEMKHNDNPC
ncbi:MAG: lysophospholipid acyltransferase family protein [Acutalibacteraceae bacterium]|nr:lysophospholipid acyltransferase family protein [Acutalibacteraceae bacterium]